MALKLLLLLGWVRLGLAAAHIPHAVRRLHAGELRIERGRRSNLKCNQEKCSNNSPDTGPKNERKWSHRPPTFVATLNGHPIFREKGKGRLRGYLGKEGGLLVGCAEAENCNLVGDDAAVPENFQAILLILCALGKIRFLDILCMRSNLQQHRGLD